MIFIRLLSWLAWLIGGSRKVSDIPLKFSIELENKNYELIEQIDIKCTIKNMGESEVNLLILFRKISIYLQHEDDKEPVVLNDHVLLRELMRSIVLKPGESHRFDRIIDRETYFMPERVGSYQMYLVYSNWSSKLSGVKLWTGEVKSNKVQIVISKKTKCSLKEAIDIANRELMVKQNFVVAQKNIIADEQNTLWKERYLSNDQVKESNQQIIEKLKNRDYWAIFYTPKESGKIMGGEAWIFVDKNTGEIILLFYLK